MEENIPNYDNVVIWAFNDIVDGKSVNTTWQLLYALPEGFGISCCMPDYINANFEDLQSRYICVVRGGDIEARCAQAGYVRVLENEDTVLFKRY